jgi:hypothetical protein
VPLSREQLVDAIAAAYGYERLLDLTETELAEATAAVAGAPA